MSDQQGKTGAGMLRDGTTKKDSPLSYVADLFRLNLISEKILGKEPLSRGTRESHFAESWAYAAGHYDEQDRTNVIGLDRYMALARRMRELSPHEEGKHIAVMERLLSPSPPANVILGSPYDEPPEGAFTPVREWFAGKKKDKGGR